LERHQESRNPQRTSGVRLAKQQFALSPIYLPSYTPVQGPQARRFANNYTRLFIRYPGLEDSALRRENMTGGEKFKMEST
jgi:hypothetical protein